MQVRSISRRVEEMEAERASLKAQVQEKSRDRETVEAECLRKDAEVSKRDLFIEVLGVEPVLILVRSVHGRLCGFRTT